MLTSDQKPSNWSLLICYSRLLQCVVNCNIQLYIGRHIRSVLFSCMRLSNVLPDLSAAFDVTRHLTRGDVIFGPTFCTVIVKWSKLCKIVKKLL